MVWQRSPLLAEYLRRNAALVWGRLVTAGIWVVQAKLEGGVFTLSSSPGTRARARWVFIPYFTHNILSLWGTLNQDLSRCHRFPTPRGLRQGDNLPDLRPLITLTRPDARGSIAWGERSSVVTAIPPLEVYGKQSGISPRQSRHHLPAGAVNPFWLT